MNLKDTENYLPHMTFVKQLCNIIAISHKIKKTIICKDILLLLNLNNESCLKWF